jgi:hypothetical protein
MARIISENALHVSVQELLSSCPFTSEDTPDMFRISSSHSGDHEELHLGGYNAV